jgi:hypothetical protein
MSVVINTFFFSYFFFFTNQPLPHGVPIVHRPAQNRFSACGAACERDARDALRRLQSAQSDGLTAFGEKMPALVRGALAAALAFRLLSDACVCPCQP